MSIHIEAIYHSPRSKWAYAYDKNRFHLRVRTKRSDVERVFVAVGDKYDWESHHDEKSLLRTASDRLFDYWETEIYPEFKRFSYAFRFEAGEATVWMTESGFHDEQPVPPGGYFAVPFIHEIDLFAAPEWAKSAVFYQIMPDRFADGDPANNPEDAAEWGAAPTRDRRFGGDFQGMIDRLDHLTDLGVNAIYLTPIFEASSYHKYDTSDYEKIDPQFGDAAMLKQLTDACHERGIKVVLDAVFNHSGIHFGPFKDVVERGMKSLYVDWFHIRSFPIEVSDGGTNYDTFGFFGHMPKLNTANPDTKKYLLGAAEKWTKEAGIDGWRLDVADEIDHSFWRDFRKTVKDANPDAYMIGEVWSDSLRWLHGEQFDSVMNYPFANVVNAFFSPGEPDAGDFAERINGLLMRYPQQANEVIFNLLSSHDTPRALTQLGGDKRRLKLAIVFLMTFIGTPCIFYGDEIGLQGEGDPDCRKCMEWDETMQDRELFDFYRLLIGLRRDYDALRSGRFRFLQADKGGSGVVYERIDAANHFTIWMNNAEEEVMLEHPMDKDDWRDALSGEEAKTEDGIMRTGLEPLGYRILYRSLQKN